MNAIFYVSAAIAAVATLMTITRTNAVHALLYLAVSLLAVAMVFFTLGAPFAAALEVVVYAGAIVVLFVFVVMMLNQGPATVRQERAWLTPGAWIGPGILTLILFGELVGVIAWVHVSAPATSEAVDPKAVGIALFGPYALAVEMASLLLLAGLVAAFHLGRHED
jgi:NADH-quinone oxidoreductase subunit J